MSDTYQAVYDAVRSRMSNGDVGQAIQEVARSAFDMGNIVSLAQQEISIVGQEMVRPSVLFKPDLKADGNAWIALYGDNLQVGCAGCGDTPSAAMEDFDKNWHNATL